MSETNLPSRSPSPSPQFENPPNLEPKGRRRFKPRDQQQQFNLPLGEDPTRALANTAGQAANVVGPTANQLGQTVGQTAGQVGQTVGQVGQAVGQVAGGGSGKDTLKLRLDLNLDVDVQIKARVHGDVTLPLLS